MRDSTVLVVLLLITVGTAKDGKWERVTLGSLTKRGSLLVNLLVHCSPECNSGDCNMQQRHYFLDCSRHQYGRHHNTIQQYSAQWGCGLLCARCLTTPHHKIDQLGSRHRVHHYSYSSV